MAQTWGWAKDDQEVGSGLFGTQDLDTTMGHVFVGAFGHSKCWFRDFWGPFLNICLVMFIMLLG